MARKAELAGVAHNIAHHAGSGLSFISPHLAEALRKVGETTTKINLLERKPYPGNAAKNRGLKNALAALHRECEAILATHGFSTDDVSAIDLYATPAPWDADGYLLHTRVVIRSDTGREYDSGWLQ